MYIICPLYFVYQLSIIILIKPDFLMLVYKINFVLDFSTALGCKKILKDRNFNSLYTNTISDKYKFIPH